MLLSDSEHYVLDWLRDFALSMDRPDRVGGLRDQSVECTPIRVLGKEFSLTEHSTQMSSTGWYKVRSQVLRGFDHGKIAWRVTYPLASNPCGEIPRPFRFNGRESVLRSDLMMLRMAMPAPR